VEEFLLGYLMFKFQLALALLGGINFRFSDIVKDPIGWLKGYAWRVLLSGMLMVPWVYLFLPAANGPLWGTGLPLSMMLAGQVGLAALRSKDEEGEELRNGIIALALVLGAQGAFWLFNSPLFRAQDYQKMLGTLEQVKEEAELIDHTTLRLVPPEFADKAADKPVGALPQASSFEVSLTDNNVQNVGGRVIFVAPLDYVGWNQYFSLGGEGAPAYIRFDASRPTQPAQLVKTLPDGRPVRIIYTQSAMFGHDIDRHIYTHGYSGYDREISFQEDDQGFPKWVAVLSQPQIGYSASDPKLVLVIDPESGEITEYPVEKAPEWIDKIYSEEMILERINWAGKLKNGFWASLGWGSKVGLWQATQESGDALYFFLDSNKKGYWWSGVTSLARDTSLKGVIAIDTRTGKGKLRELSGNGGTETAISETLTTKAAALTPSKTAYATMPFMYRIYGQDTWIAPIMDNGTLVGFGVAHSSHAVYGFGKTLDAALSDYQRNLLLNPEVTGLPKDATQRKVRFRVIQVVQPVEGGTTRVILRSETGNIYSAYISDIQPGQKEELVLTQPGELVEVEVADIKARSTQILSIDNLNLPAPAQVVPKQR